MTNKQIIAEVLSNWIAMLGYSPDQRSLLLVRSLINEALELKDQTLEDTNE